MTTTTEGPPSALDVAEYILERCGPLEPIKLQKLVYYCQAWSLAWGGSPIFREEVQAWVHGPVVSELYQMHAQLREVLAVGGHTERLRAHDREVIEEVLRYYGDADSNSLRELTHREEPWRAARGGLPENLPSTKPITHDQLRAFYTGRPCGGGEPVTDFSGLSTERVERAREELVGGSSVDIDGLGIAVAGQG